MRRRIALLCFVLAAAALAATALRWRGASAEVAGLAAERAQLAAALDTTSANLRKTALRYRGFLKSTVPDSLRLSEAGRSMQQSNLYRKSINSLEGDERRLRVLLAKVDTRLTAATAARRRNTIPPLAATVVLLAAGGVALATRRSPPGVAP